MAEEFQEKTERATPRKKQKAKEKGQVSRSRDLTSMVSMAGIVAILYFGGGYMFVKLSEITGGILSFRYGNDPAAVISIAVTQAAYVLAPIFIVSFTLVIGASVMQGGFVVKPLKFEFEKLNPVAGIKRIFSSRGLVELLKSLLKFLTGSWMVYFIIKKDMKIMTTMPAMEMNEIMKVSGKMLMDAVLTAFLFYFAIAIVGALLEKWQYEKSLRMTKQEVKEEHKDIEGDPVIKARIRSAQREAARKRMMQEVKTATVVITNPQHLAVALKYLDKEMAAPKIVAKGAGFVAAKIREIAKEHGIPVIEDKPIARALFKQEINTFIPEELYVAVARILAYVYKMRGNA